MNHLSISEGERSRPSIRLGLLTLPSQTTSSDSKTQRPFTILTTKRLHPTQRSLSRHRKGSRSLCYHSVSDPLTRNRAARSRPPYSVRLLPKPHYRLCDPVLQYPCNLNSRKCNHQPYLPFTSLFLVPCVILRLPPCLQSLHISLSPLPRPQPTPPKPLHPKEVQCLKRWRLSCSRKLRYQSNRIP